MTRAAISVVKWCIIAVAASVYIVLTAIDFAIHPDK
jgi:hypothetical protein